MRKITFIIIIATFSLWLGGLIAFFEKIPETQNQIQGEYDAVIVLTGGSGRIAEGIKLLRAKKSWQMLISGVHQNTRIEQLVRDIDFGNITLGAKARTTKGNGMEAKEWVEKNSINSIILVTANYHIPRALSIFKREMPYLQIQPQPVFPQDFDKKNWYKNRNTMRLVLAEYNKYLLTF